MMDRFYFQLARGRAIVRTRAMREARRRKARGETWLVQHEVARARRANREWRHYRRRYLELRDSIFRSDP